MNGRRWNGMAILGMALLLASGSTAVAQSVEKEVVESRQNIVVERTGQPRIEVEVENGEIVVLVDGVVRERVENPESWRGTEIKDEDGEVIVKIVRDPETGFISMDGEEMLVPSWVDADSLWAAQRFGEVGEVELNMLPPRHRQGLQAQLQGEWQSADGDISRPLVQLNAAPGLPVMMGITMEPVAGALAHHLGLEPNRSTLVTSVVPRSPAAESGLIVHDIIVRIEVGADAGPTAIRDVLRGKSAGDEVELRVLRGPGEERTLTVKLAETEQVQSFYLRRVPSVPGVPGVPEVPGVPGVPGAGAAPTAPGLSSRAGVVEEEEVVIEADERMEELRSHVEGLRLEIERRQREVRGEMSPEARVEALAGLRERIVELDASQAELTRLRNEQIREQLGRLREQAVDLDLALPQMLMEMMLEEEGRSGGRRMVFEVPSQQRLLGDEAAMQSLVEQLRSAAEGERLRLGEELAASRDRERELALRLERMERQLETLMQAMEQMVSTRADGVKPGEGSPE